MSNPQPASLLNEGKDAVADWIRTTPGGILDLSKMSLMGFDFSGWDLANADLGGCQLNEADFTAANLSGATLWNAVLVNVKLCGANLDGANCENAAFENCDFSNAKINGANFTSARLIHVKSLPKEGMRHAKFLEANITANLESFDLSKIDLSGVVFTNCDLRASSFIGATLKDAQFRSCDLTEAYLTTANCEGSDFQHSNLTRAFLQWTNLRSSDLSYANLSGSDVSRADFYEAYVSNSNFDKVKGATLAKNLHRVRFRPIDDDAMYFESVIVPPLQKYISWERIRFLGRLPLFGASYATLVAIPFLYYFLDLYNRQVSLLNGWASEEIAKGDLHATLAKQLINHLHREPIPKLSLLLLGSTFLLGIGATIFALACPSRVREFSRDQWCDELGHSLMTYLPISWWYPWLRSLCVALYFFGGMGILIVLSSKLLNVFHFILQNS